jgi:hypothetical protein
MAGERRKDYMVSRRVHTLYVLTWLTSLFLVGSLVMMAYQLRGASQAMPEAGQTSFIMVGALAFVIVCSALLLAVYTIVHTHRLMGSAYRIGVVLREVNAGQPTRIHLRDGDFFLDIADEINLLADRQQGKVETPASVASFGTPVEEPAADAPEKAEEQPKADEKVAEAAEPEKPEAAEPEKPEAAEPEKPEAADTAGDNA